MGEGKDYEFKLGNDFAKANSKFKDEYCEQAIKLCKLGAVDKDLADFFGVCEKTINTWKITHESFLQSVYKGKDYFDSEQVAGALKSRALGYSHKEEKVFCNMGVITTHETTKHYPPDVKACEILLNNRNPDRWQNKQKVEHSGEITNKTIDLSKISDKALEELRKSADSSAND